MIEFAVADPREERVSLEVVHPVSVHFAADDLGQQRKVVDAPAEERRAPLRIATGDQVREVLRDGPDTLQRAAQRRGQLRAQQERLRVVFMGRAAPLLFRGETVQTETGSRRHAGLARVGCRRVPHVVEQHGHPQALAKAGPDAGLEASRVPREQGLEHARRDLHRAEPVGVARVRGAGKRLVRETELFDAPQALVHPAVHHGQLILAHRDAAVNRVADADHVGIASAKRV